MFSTPESAKISDAFVSVRILGGNDLDEKGEAFFQKYGVRAYPTLLAVTAGGDLLDADLFDGQLRDAAYVLEALRQAKRENESFLGAKARWLAKGDLESLDALAKRYEQRRNFAKARQLHERILELEPTSVERHLQLVSVVRRLGDEEAERSVLETLLERFPDHADHPTWLVRKATMHLGRPTSPQEVDQLLERYVEVIEKLRQEAADADRTADEAGLRGHLAALEADRGDEEKSKAHVSWILENAADTPAALTVQMMRTRQAMEERDPETARQYATWVIEHGPDSEQAAGAHMFLGELAYEEDDLETATKHFETVVRIAPESRMGRIAKDATAAIARQRAESAAPAEGEKTD